jgi:hypothetical protein
MSIMDVNHATIEEKVDAGLMPVLTKFIGEESNSECGSIRAFVQGAINTLQKIAEYSSSFRDKVLDLVIDLLSSGIQSQYFEMRKSWIELIYSLVAR